MYRKIEYFLLVGELKNLVSDHVLAATDKHVWWGTRVGPAQNFFIYSIESLNTYIKY